MSDQEVTDPAPTDPAPAQGADPDRATTPPAAPEKVLTQAQVDKLVSERVARERAKFADYAELKAKATEHDKIVDAQRSEQERAVEAARKEGAESVLTVANQRLVAYAALAAAAEADFRSPSLAVKALDLSKVSVSEDGEVDADALKAALKELAEAEPYLIKDDTPPAPKRPKADPSQGSGKTTEPAGGQKGRDEAARRFGARQNTAA